MCLLFLTENQAVMTKVVTAFLIITAFLQHVNSWFANRSHNVWPVKRIFAGR